MNPERFVILALESMGYKPKKMLESDIKSPDFIVECGNRKYLIELKTKLDDLSKIKEREAIFNSGHIYEENTRIGYKKTIAKRVKQASTQLTSLSIDVDYRVTWLLALGEQTDVQLKQFEMTLYGARNLFDLNDGSNNMKSCFYFGESSFFRYRNRIDAAVIATTEKAKLCLNNHSPNYKSFKSSELCLSFGKGLVDPIEREAEGEAYIADGEINRSDKAAMLKHVQEKYGKPRLIDLNFTHHSASMTVPCE